MGGFNVSQLAVPAVTALIIFLAYSSQYLFLYIEPSPLSKNQLIKFNVLLGCLWICYYRACTTDPGRVPPNWEPSGGPESNDRNQISHDPGEFKSRQRWCRRCEALKPPRAHHCKSCGRCVPKMDHHCPWTANCVSHFTFPHFIRFVFYAVVSMVYLEYFLYFRIAIIWHRRHEPSYMGPSISQFIHLFFLTALNSIVMVALIVLLIRTLWLLGANTTTIEVWEIERHKTLCRRARVLGGYLDGPDGIKVPIRKQEFPYDIGIWENIRDGMGGSTNVLSWFWPFSATPRPGTGLEFEVNGFEDPDVTWPPPDPDRISRQPPLLNNERAFTYSQQYQSSREEIEAFRLRQQEDIKRYDANFSSTIHRRRPFHQRYAQNLEPDEEDYSLSEDEFDSHSDSGEEAWRNREGERLRDFGVDEEVEFYDEDDIPLAELLRRRRKQA